jgi:hypothetical protein
MRWSRCHGSDSCVVELRGRVLENVANGVAEHQQNRDEANRDQSDEAYSTRPYPDSSVSSARNMDRTAKNMDRISASQCSWRDIPKVCQVT